MNSDILNSNIYMVTSNEKGQSLSHVFTCLLVGSFMFYRLFLKGCLRGSGRWSNSTRGVLAVQYEQRYAPDTDCK